jgi:hypothetical protein
MGAGRRRSARGKRCPSERGSTPGRGCFARRSPRNRGGPSRGLCDAADQPVHRPAHRLSGVLAFRLRTRPGSDVHGRTLRLNRPERPCARHADELDSGTLKLRASPLLSCSQTTRGHKTDTSETTHATSRDVRADRRRARFVRRNCVASDHACTRVTLPNW